MTFDAGTKEAGHGPAADPWQAANEAKEPSRFYFGQVFADVWFCILVKGQGKVKFDPAQHKAGQRRTAIDLDLTPLVSSGLTFTVERDMIAESREWAGIVLPSLKALNIDLRALNRKWAKVELVPSRTYKDKEGNEKQATTFKFHAVFDTQAECEAAANAFFGQFTGDDNPPPLEPDSTPQQAQQQQPQQQVQQPMPTNGKNSDPQREVALKFLPALVQMAAGDPGKLNELISQNDLVSKYFTINSPEVIQLLADATF